MKFNPKHISPLTVDDLIRERDAIEPGFAAKVEARVAELALARKVRALREKRGLTQAQLGKKSRTATSAISRIESGRDTPTLRELGRIAGALGARINFKMIATRT